MPSKIVLLGLALGAVVCPLPLYLVAIAALGLPHVLWEWAWIRQTVWPSVPRGVRHAILASLLIQAIGRSGAWMGFLSGHAVIVSDLLSLALGMAGIWFWPMPGRHTRPVKSGLAILIVGLVAAPYAAHPEASMLILLVLSVAHNATPIGLSYLAGDAHRAATWRRIFWLPVLLIVWPLAPLWPSAPSSASQIPDIAALQQVGMPTWPGLAATLVAAPMPALLRGSTRSARSIRQRLVGRLLAKVCARA